MRKLQITLIALFLAVAIAFCAVFLHDRLTADHTAPRIVSDGVPLEVSVNATDAELCAGLTAADDRSGRPRRRPHRPHHRPPRLAAHGREQRAGDLHRV